MLITAMMILIIVLLGLLPDSVNNSWIGYAIGIATAIIAWGVIVSDWGRAK
jgi:hypothetical protein